MFVAMETSQMDTTPPSPPLPSPSPAGTNDKNV